MYWSYGGCDNISHSLAIMETYPNLLTISIILFNTAIFLYEPPINTLFSTGPFSDNHISTAFLNAFTSDLIDSILVSIVSIMEIVIALLQIILHI